MMSLAKIIASTVALAAILPVAASAQTYNTVVEPVPAPEDLSNIVRARHIRPGDVSPEEYAKLLEEAEKVRSFQSTGTYTGASASSITTTPVETYSTQTYSSYEAAPVTTTTTSTVSSGYTIELFEPAETETVTYASTPSVTSYTTTVTSEPVVSSYGSHTVVKGDTLYSLARRHNVALSDLKSANGLADNNIKLGQVLTIPSSGRTVITENTYAAQPTLVRNVQPLPTGNVYAVLPGDTLYGISRRACTSVSEVATLNGISPRGILKPGQRLTMPSNHCLR